MNSPLTCITIVHCSVAISEPGNSREHNKRRNENRFSELVASFNRKCDSFPRGEDIFFTSLVKAASAFFLELQLSPIVLLGKDHTYERKRKRETERETHRNTERDTERERKREGERKRERGLRERKRTRKKG